MRDVMPMDVDNHLDEVLGIVEKPKKEIVKSEKIVPVAISIYIQLGRSLFKIK